MLHEVSYYCGIWWTSVQRTHKKIIPPEDHWLRAAPVIFGSLSLCSCRALVPGHIWPAAQAAKQAPVDRESLWGEKKCRYWQLEVELIWTEVVGEHGLGQDTVSACYNVTRKKHSTIQNTLVIQKFYPYRS